MGRDFAYETKEYLQRGTNREKSKNVLDMCTEVDNFEEGEQIFEI